MPGVAKIRHGTQTDENATAISSDDRPAVNDRKIREEAWLHLKN